MNLSKLKCNIVKKDLGKNVLEKIKKKEIKPKPKWMFSLKDIGFWIMFSISLILGSISTSLIIFILRNNDWDLHRKLGHGLFKFILITLPYFWLLILIVLIIASYLNFKCTRKGYKYNPLLVVFINILISMVLGSLFYIFGLGAKMEDSLEKKIPPYGKMFYQRHEMWDNPEKGLIGGKIIVFESNNNFKIISLKQKEWDILSKDPIITPKLILREGERVKIIGEMIDNNIFEAEEIRPFIDKKLFFERNRIEMRIR